MPDLYAEMLRSIAAQQRVVEQARAARDRALGRTATFGKHTTTHFGQPGGLGDLPGFAHVTTVEAITDLNTRIVHLQTDIMALSIPEPVDPTTADQQAHIGKHLELTGFQSGYTGFKSRWDVWRREHTSWLSRVGDEPMRAFEDFRTEYNEWLRRFKQSFGSDKTQAKPRTRDKPPDPLRAVQTTVNLVSLAVIGAVAVYAYSQVKRR